MIKIIQILLKPFLGTGIGKYQPFKLIYQSINILINLLIPKKLIIKTLYGFKLIIDTEKIKTGIDTLILGGYYEKLESDLIKQISLDKKDFIFIDIGANIGYYSLLVANSISTGKVLSYEPLNLTYNLLNDNIKFNNKYNIITTIKKGIGNINDEITIYYNEKDLLLTSTNTSNFYDHNKSEKINIIKLDSEINNFKKIDLIKIDIEGEELNALKGMVNILENYIPTIIFEFAYELYNENEKNEIFELLLKYKYKIFEINEQNKILIEFDIKNVKKLYFKYTNFICIHESNLNSYNNILNNII